MSMLVYGQQEVTKFLGIPVDGSKSEMIRKLKEKGFKSTIENKDILTGEFNGTTVNVFIATNNDKVYRIMVCDANTQSAGDIKIRFNNLYRQFRDNGKYLPSSLEVSGIIPEDEDISYNITVNDKRYEAVFYQLPMHADSISMKKEIMSVIKEKYSEEQLASPTEEMKKEIAVEALMNLYKKAMYRPVWFTISPHYGKYYITMYYDNKYNQANGEDL